ncbi:hypothetical protein RB195_003004 [Necator americanus]|uniref:Bestrophin homolog n=1 Tax=Necator americanus TaxID=51031 RepID=A0ABR1DMG9_NECAM
MMRTLWMMQNVRSSQMTVSYNLDVSSVSAFSFLKLLFRWRGSIWKSIAAELLLWLCGYYTVFLTYRMVLDENAKKQFERIAEHCDDKLKYIPLTFMLGFFVTIVVDRWRSIFQNMGWIENLALTVTSLLRGDSKEAILYRRTIIRYAVLCQVLVFRDVSMRVRRRFPNMESLVVAGFLHENELLDLENIKLIYNKYWAPINWSLTLCMKAYKEGLFETLPAVINVQTEIKNFRASLAQLCNYDWVPIPIAYPQVVFLAVRVYFLICIVSRQFIISIDAKNKSVIDLYVPFMTMLQFTFFVGWMKVAEALLNPLGEDDDDFECNFLIDKNIATGMAIVDETYDSCPQLLPDRFADPDFHPIYSEDSHKNGTDGTLQGSAEGVELAKDTDQVKMVAVDRRTSVGDDESLRSRKPSALSRKISNALGVQRRSHSIQPVHLSTVHQIPFDYSPSHVTVDIQNGEKKASSTGNVLEIVKEEEGVELDPPADGREDETVQNAQNPLPSVRK